MSDKQTEALWYRNYAVHIEGDPLFVMGMEEPIANVQSVQNLTRHQALRRIFKAGLKMLGADPNVGNVSIQSNARLSELHEAVKRKAAQARAFQELYKDIGADKLQEIAETEGLDFGEFLSEYRLERMLSPSAQMQLWLKAHLADGKEHEASEILSAAIEDGMLPSRDNEDFEQAHNLFKAKASQMGASGGRRGYWQLVQAEVS